MIAIESTEESRIADAIKLDFNRLLTKAVEDADFTCPVMRTDAIKLFVSTHGYSPCHAIQDTQHRFHEMFQYLDDHEYAGTKARVGQLQLWHANEWSKELVNNSSRINELNEAIMNIADSLESDRIDAILSDLKEDALHCQIELDKAKDRSSRVIAGIAKCVDECVDGLTAAGLCVYRVEVSKGFSRMVDKSGAVYGAALGGNRFFNKSDIDMVDTLSAPSVFVSFAGGNSKIFGLLISDNLVVEPWPKGEVDISWYPTDRLLPIRVDREGNYDMTALRKCLEVVVDLESSVAAAGRADDESQEIFAGGHSM